MPHPHAYTHTHGSLQICNDRYDQLHLRVVSKPLSAAPRLEADCLVEIARKASNPASTLSSDDQARLYELAFQKYDLVLKQNTDDVAAMTNYALALHRYAKDVTNAGRRSDACAHFRRSQTLLLQALELLGVPYACCLTSVVC